MEIKVLPQSLLKGKSFRCQPVEDGPIVEAQIIRPRKEEELTALETVFVVCPERRPCSRCGLRIKADNGKYS